MRSPLLLVAILLVALLIGGVAAPFFIDWSTYRTEIEDYGRRLMGRGGTLEEMCKLFAFVISDDNSFMTGTNVVYDGGISLGMPPQQ